MTRHRPLAPLLVITALAIVLAGCGDGDSNSPTFVTVPLDCDAVLDRLEERANWPAEATLANLQGVNNDLFAVLDRLDEDCDSDVFERYDQIKCDYFTSASGADAAADAFIQSQADACTDDGPDPDEPVATIEDPAATVPSARE